MKLNVGYMIVLAMIIIATGCTGMDVPLTTVPPTPNPLQPILDDAQDQLLREAQVVYDGSLSYEELVRGDQVVLIGDGWAENLILTSNPFLDESTGEHHLYVAVVENNGTAVEYRLRDYNCAYLGLVAYNGENGLYGWETINHLMPTGKVRLTEDELLAIIDQGQQ